MTDEKEMTIEEAFAALEDILNDLDSEQNGLEETFTKYQKGLAYVKLLKSRIDGIEKKLAILEKENGDDNV